ncbi:MAG: SxtJ family membrane protein [Ignavibacteria bacterium]|jgi:hypothetical protein
MKKEKYLETLITISTGFLILFLFFDIKAFIYVAIALGIISLFWRKAAEIISLLWLKLGEGMGFVVSKVILSFIFFFILFPVARVSRLFNKDFLLLKGDNLKSIFFEVNRKYEPKDFEKMW